MEKIYFKLTDPDFGFMSNFYPWEITVDGVRWKTTEHYYQAQKSLDPEIQKLIRDLPRPVDTKRASKLIRIRPDWEEYKIQVMTIALAAKFQPGTKLTEMLLMTDGIELVEWAPWDEFWGAGKKGTGQNMLGTLLMRRREQLKALLG